MKRKNNNKFSRRAPKIRKGPKIRQKPIKTLVGKLSGSGHGYAFLTGGDFEDVMIPAKYLHGAIHGDTAEVDVFSDHGEVKRIVNEGPREITGVYVRDMKRIAVVPDDRHYSHDISVAEGKAEIGDRVLIRMLKDRTRGVIVKVLGKAGTLEADIAAVIARLGIEDFKFKALKEAELMAARPISFEGRTDFTDQPCFTIDGEDSKDFDDAVYAEETEGGCFKLYVHIADVADYVPLHGHTDKEAYNRGNSFYYGQKVIPMLPESLCNDMCSLNENADRLTLSAVMDISSKGEITGGQVCEGVIRSHKRMTYENVEKALKGEFDGYDEFMPTLKTIRKLRDVLKSARDANGNIDFDIPEPKFKFEGEKVVSVERAPRLIAHSMIEECMIAANRFIAAKFLSLKAPFVYREHLAPQLTKIESLNAFIASMGEKPIVTVSPKAVADMLRTVPPEKSAAISRMTLRAMTKAKYSTTCEGHFGLALKEYCHFTSPIRRYSDLTIHRVIKEYLHGGDLAKFESVVKSAAVEASEREKICESAERDIDDLYIADYMSAFVGSVYDGVVSGVTEWGVFVELDNTAEGMIKIESLGRSEFNPDTMTVKTGGRVLGLGTKVKVKLESAVSGNIVFLLEK